MIFFVSSLNCRSNCGIGDIKKNWLCICVFLHKTCCSRKKKKNRKNTEVEKQTIFLKVCTENVYSFWTTDEWEGRWGVQGDQMTLVMSAASSSCWQQIVCHRLSSSVIWWQTWVSTKQAWSQAILVTSSPPVCRRPRVLLQSWHTHAGLSAGKPKFHFHSVVKPQL